MSFPIEHLSKVEPSYEMEDVFFQSDMRIEIEEMFKILTPREGDVLKHYFGLDGYKPKTLKKIAFDVFDLTADRVRLIKNRALRKLKKEFSESA